MTPEERDLAFNLVMSPRGTSRLSAAEFTERTAIDQPREWALEELRDAIRRRDADDAEAALVVGAVFGRDHRWATFYQDLLMSDWHVLHEGAAAALGDLGDAGSVPALIHASHHVPEYLEFDESRALASTAIHSLGKIPGPEAEASLKALITTLEDRPLRATAQRVLDRRNENPPAASRSRTIPPRDG